MSLIIMEKSYDSDSLRKWPVAQLKVETQELWDMISNVECFGSRDVAIFNNLVGELERRGYEISGMSRLKFLK